MVPELVVLALDYFREPLRFAHLADPQCPLPSSFDNLVEDFGSALAPRNIEATATALGVTRGEVEQVARFFLRQVLLSPRSNHYRVLGLSPNASDEAIRRHYQLLIRIVHPDRSLSDDGRDAAHTARINEAYNVLKNPVTRQLYDRHLASTTGGAGRTQATSSALTRSSAPIRAYAYAAQPDARFSNRGRRSLLVLVWGGAAVVLVAGIVILLFDRAPLLRVNPDLADLSKAKPSFLKESPPAVKRHLGFQDKQRSSSKDAVRVVEEEPRQVALTARETRSRVNAFAQPTPAPAKSSERSGSMGGDLCDAQAPQKAVKTVKTVSPKTKAISKTIPVSSKDADVISVLKNSDRRAAAPQEGKTSARRTHDADKSKGVRSQPPAPVSSRAKAVAPKDLIARLTRYYQTGDLNGFVNLFAANAQVNDGSGKAFIRADYAELFSDMNERRLSISGLKWRPTDGGKVLGWGRYRVRVKKKQSTTWRSSSGKLFFELVSAGSGYKISSMIYR